MSFRIQVRRDTSENWSDTNPVLAEGEIGLEIDTGLFKVGDGSTSWNDLSYYGTSYFALKHHTHSINDIVIDSDKSWNNKSVTDINLLQASDIETEEINLHYHENEYNIIATTDGLSVGSEGNTKILIQDNKITNIVPTNLVDYYIQQNSLTIGATTTKKIHLLKRQIESNSAGCYAIYFLQWKSKQHPSNNGYILFTIAANNHEDYDITLNILSSVYNGFNPLSILSVSFTETTNPYMSYVDLVIDNTSNDQYVITVKLLQFIDDYYEIALTDSTSEPVTILNQIDLGKQPDFCLTNEQNKNITVTKGQLNVNDRIIIGNDVKVSNHNSGLQTDKDIVLNRLNGNSISCLFGNNSTIQSQVTSIYNTDTNKEELHIWNKNKVVIETKGDEQLKNTVKAQFGDDGIFQAPIFQPYGTYNASDGSAGITKTIEVMLTNLSTASLKFVDGILVSVQVHGLHSSSGISSSSSSSSFSTI